jgi:hypothetical protein
VRQKKSNRSCRCAGAEFLYGRVSCAAKQHGLSRCAAGSVGFGGRAVEMAGDLGGEAVRWGPG